MMLIKFDNDLTSVLTDELYPLTFPSDSIQALLNSHISRKFHHITTDKDSVDELLAGFEKPNCVIKVF